MTSGGVSMFNNNLVPMALLVAALPAAGQPETSIIERQTYVLPAWSAAAERAPM